MYCRIRPIFHEGGGSIADFIGQDGSLVISDPSKPQREGRKIFKFNKVFGPTSSQSTSNLSSVIMEFLSLVCFSYF